MNKFLAVLISVTMMFCLVMPAQAQSSIDTQSGQVNFFTEHQAIKMTRHRVFNPYAPTGKIPYIGRVGLEYEHGRFAYSVGYMHRSNIDIGGNEYNYDGISLGIKYTHCLVGC